MHSTVDLGSSNMDAVPFSLATCPRYLLVVGRAGALLVLAPTDGIVGTSRAGDIPGF
jgi:hypothetical protein